MKQQERYCNPVPYLDGCRRTNPDPHVIRWCGKWYCYSSDTFGRNGVKVSVSDDLVHWNEVGFCIPSENQKHFWAPAVIYLNGVFYMYYSAVPLDSEDDHDEHLMLAAATRPEGPFHWKKTFFQEFSIDAHPLFWHGKMYLLYAVNNWIGTDDTVAGTCILLDELTAPDTLAGNPKPVVLPSLPQEIFAKNRFGDGRDWYTIEGAAVLTRKDRMWLMYSANCFLHEDYFVGTAVAETKPALMEMDFQKYPSPHRWGPLLKRSASTEGTGHNTVTKAPNLVDDWIVYHGRRMSEPRDATCEQREMYIDPLYRNGNGLFCLGPTDTEQPAPAKPSIQCTDVQIQKAAVLCAAPACYTAEFWISAKRQHTGTRYALRLWQTSETNYLELELRSGRKGIGLIRCREGVRTILYSAALSDGFDYTAPHLLRVDRNFGSWQITLNEILELSVVDFFESEAAEIGIVPYFSELMLHSFALTQTTGLNGLSLAYLTKFYSGVSGNTDEEGLHLTNGCVHFCAQNAECYTEEFQLKPCGEDASIQCMRDSRALAELQKPTQAFSVYHFKQGQKEQWIVNGIPTPWLTIAESTTHTLKLCNMILTEYRFTKK